MGSPFMISARAHSSHQYWYSALIGSMSLTMGVPLPHQSHLRLWAPISQLQLWPQAVHT